MQIRKRILVVGEAGSGKTTLIRALTAGENVDLRKRVKTQAVDYYEYFVDTPGEFLENPYYRKYLLSLSQNCRCILLVQDCSKERCTYPPGFAKSFPALVFGVVSKADLGTEKEYSRAQKWLVQAGVKEIFIVSAVMGIGMDRLRDALSKACEIDDLTER
ncbi:MAG: EutP/PduV family microcompartment system protein [Thermacetogeniaceae bacterium]